MRQPANLDGTAIWGNVPPMADCAPKAAVRLGASNSRFVPGPVNRSPCWQMNESQLSVSSSGAVNVSCEGGFGHHLAPEAVDQFKPLRDDRTNCAHAETSHTNAYQMQVAGWVRLEQSRWIDRQ